jgi:O-methyltransferase involved in polyketide biosynthesis
MMNTMSNIAPSHFLSSTAYRTAAVRAQVNRRTDKLFDDPWAERLAGEEGIGWIAGRSPEAVVTIVLRTRWFDGSLRRAASEERIRQIVLVAAGLDTRTWRIAWPEMPRMSHHWFVTAVRIG